MSEHDEETKVTTRRSLRIKGNWWLFSEYRCADVMWWQIGEEEKECAYFEDEDQAWAYWENLLPNTVTQQ